VKPPASTVIVPVLLALAVVGLRLARPLAAPPPSLTVGRLGPAQAVFDTRVAACERIDIPDANPRAFRDYRGAVHLVATHYVARAMLGPSLDRVARDCRVIYRSPQDPNPAHFQDRNWLMSFYTEDGRRIAALVHSEYEADTVPGMCPPPQPADGCWWNTITFAQSFDGGYRFRQSAAPANLVASLPYRYRKRYRTSPYGYTSPTNILKLGDFYYAMINDWPFRAQHDGACLIRTASLFEPSSWRAWDGSAFAVRFIDPYRDAKADPRAHVCPPLFPGGADSLSIDRRTGRFVVARFAPDDRFGPPGLYLSASADLVHWSQPVLAAAIRGLHAAEGPGNWRYDYFSLLDPTSADRNFATIGGAPFLYYVRFDDNNPPYARILFRRRIELRVDG
jgi:hypothetical protein